MTSIKSKLASFVMLGFDSNLNDSFNRVTIFSNSISYLALLGFAANYLQLKGLGISSDFTSYLLFFSALASTVLPLNYFKQYNLARLMAYSALTIGCYFAAVVYGKSFNGYYLAFISIVFSIYAFTHMSALARIAAFLPAITALPIIDYLSYTDVIPITGFNSKDFPFLALQVDTIAITLGISVTLFVEKRFADKHENQLKEFNEKLEALVQKRTLLLFKAKEEAVQASIQKSQFVANTSHELRTPLQGILGNLDLLKMRLGTIEKDTSDSLPPIEKAKSSLEKASNNASRLVALIQKLLDLTRLDGSDIKPHPSEFEATNFLEEIISNFSKKNNGKEVLWKKPNHNINAHTDRTLIEKSLNHMLDNAHRYGKKDTPINVDLSHSDDLVTVKITNEGFGIPEGEEDQIFEAFFQSSVTDERTGGTGLGLTLSRKVMRSLGGTLELINPSPQSTTFALTFPLSYEKKSS